MLRVVQQASNHLPILACVGDVFRALADPTRRSDPRRAGEREGQTLFELCSRLATKHGSRSSRQAISQHLEVLEDAGLVSTRREGRYKFHDLRHRTAGVARERWPAPTERRR